MMGPTVSNVAAQRRRVRIALVCFAMGLLAASLSVASANATEFGFAENSFSVSATNRDGTPDLQAGSHPFHLTTSLALNREDVFEATPPYDVEREFQIPVGGQPKDLEVDLPPGLVGDPSAVAQCSLKAFRHVLGLFGVYGSNECPSDSQIGMTEVEFGIGFGGKDLVQREPVFNLVSPEGAPAEFGFVVYGVPIVLIPHVRTGGDYGITVDSTQIPQALELLRSKFTLWGVPGEAAHDPERGICWNGSLTENGSGDHEGVPAITGAKAEELCAFTGPVRPFLSMPTSCLGPLHVSGRIDSWHAPGIFKEAQATMPGMGGCDKLNFAPQAVVQPEPAQADSPSGLSVEIKVPQTYNDPSGLAESNLKDTAVTLPDGVALNAAAGDGLAGCSEEQFGLHDDAEVACPDASKLGDVEVRTPLLEHPLTGGVFLAQQGNLPGNGSNPFGSLLALYLQLKDPYSGSLVKLAGEVHPDPITGQLVTTFLNNPQVPFDSLKLSFFGGPRSGLVNPPVCGTYTTQTEMAPWSGGASATPAWSFAVTSGPGGAPCTASEPFAPSLVSGTKSNQAAGFTPYSLTFYRNDGEQNMSRIQVKTPAGLEGVLASVTLCPEPQAAQGACGAQSLIGTTTVAVGAGSNPYYVTGKVYLTSSYNGAPYGLSFVVPAIAGPLNLGTVIVRAAVNVDPHTAALTITSEPLPQILQGVPLHIRAVNVTIDRERFIFNPTNCNPMAVEATMTSALGAVEHDATHFQVTNCAALSFHPDFSASTAGHASRVNGTSLDARLVEANVGGQPLLATNGGQANIARIKVELPKDLPSRLTTLHLACTAKVFEANPANCPSASAVGYAKATTPVLPVPLTGPVYFVSHGGEAFPSLIIVLQGYGVRVDVVGSTYISKQGVTSSTFAAVPDVPVSNFELYLPSGPFSALTALGNPCRERLEMPTEMVGQNGAVIRQKTPIAVTGCAKKRKATGAAKLSGARTGHRVRFGRSRQPRSDSKRSGS